MIKWVIFDVGETLIKERRVWDEWADWIGVPRDEFWAELERVIAERLDHRVTFERFKPGFDLDGARAERAAAGQADELQRSDLYVDARSTIKMLAAKRFAVGVAGNHPASTVEFFASLEWPLDLIGVSGGSETAKPAPAFFEKVIEVTETPAEEIIYVGDRIDHDILPAMAAGLHAVFLRRGPWGKAHASWPEAQDLPYVIDNLTELMSLDLLQ